jgi:hypothetical protein
MSTPNPNMWVLTNGANSPSVGTAINGCKIKQTSSAFEFYLQNGSSPVQTVNATSLPVTFEDVTIDSATWDITADTLPSTTDAGSWVTPSQAAGRPEETPPTSGDFTAQTGGGVVPDEAAASAGYGKS